MTAKTGKTKALIVGGIAAAVAVSGTGVALAATASPAGSGTPNASPHPRLLAVQRKADRRFAAALVRINALQNRVDHAKMLAADRSMLDTEISHLSGQVRTANEAVDAATTLAQARQELRADQTLVAQGRVIVRQVRQLRQADAAASAAAAATARLPSLTAKVNALPAGSPAHAALADLQNRIADAAKQSTTIAAADRALSITSPAAANSVLTGNEPALKALSVDHRKVEVDRRQIRKAVRQAGA